MSLQYSILHSKGYVTTCKINNCSNIKCNIMLTFNAAHKLHLESTTHLFLVNILPVKFWGITPFFFTQLSKSKWSTITFHLITMKIMSGRKKKLDMYFTTEIKQSAWAYINSTFTINTYSCLSPALPWVLNGLRTDVYT